MTMAMRLRLVTTFVFLTIGLVFLLGNMGLLNVDVAVRFWPVLLIAAGVFKLVEYHDNYRGGSGVFFILVGTLFLMGNFHILRMAARDIWPVILIGIGGLMLWRSVVTRRSRCPRTGRLSVRLTRSWAASTIKP